MVNRNVLDIQNGVENFVVFDGWVNVLNKTTDDSLRLQMYDALFNYCACGTEYTGDNMFVNIFITMVMPSSDSAKDRWLNAKENGKKGGRPTTVDKDKVIELSEKGMKQSDIAETLRCSVKSVGNILREYRAEQLEKTAISENVVEVENPHNDVDAIKIKDKHSAITGNNLNTNINNKENTKEKENTTNIENKNDNKKLPTDKYYEILNLLRVDKSDYDGTEKALSKLGDRIKTISQNNKYPQEALINPIKVLYDISKENDAGNYINPITDDLYGLYWIRTKIKQVCSDEYLKEKLRTSANSYVRNKQAEQEDLKAGIDINKEIIEMAENKNFFIYNDREIMSDLKDKYHIYHTDKSFRFIFTCLKNKFRQEDVILNALNEISHIEKRQVLEVLKEYPKAS